MHTTDSVVSARFTSMVAYFKRRSMDSLCCINRTRDTIVTVNLLEIWQLLFRVTNFEVDVCIGAEDVVVYLLLDFHGLLRETKIFKLDLALAKLLVKAYVIIHNFDSEFHVVQCRNVEVEVFPISDARKVNMIKLPDCLTGVDNNTPSGKDLHRVLLIFFLRRNHLSKIFVNEEVILLKLKLQEGHCSRGRVKERVSEYSKRRIQGN